MNQQDLEFSSEYDAALRAGMPRAVMVSVFAAVLFLLCFVGWAYWAELEEVTRGDGRVIPSSKTQLIQSLEGGLVKEVLVRPGDTVAKGDVLARIDDTGFSSNLGEISAKKLALDAAIVRLRHEADGDLAQLPAFSAEMTSLAPALIDNEIKLFVARRTSLDTQVDVLKQRVEQRNREMGELNATLNRLKEALRLANEEMALKKPLAAKGVVPKTEILRLQREIADATGQIAVIAESGPRISASIREAEGEVQVHREKFRQEARAQLSDFEAQISVILETVRGAQDKVLRADIRSPVDGVVNKVNANTVGGVVQAGQTIMEIVPLEDSLLVEAKIRPSDIAFIHPKQQAVVKITAYDFSIYGGLEGEVQLISADSVYDEEARESFYLVTVKTLRTQLKDGQDELPIIPGMVASVDILTGKKSVLDYILKPINKARSEAMRER